MKIITYVCDGCGKIEGIEIDHNHGDIPPNGWWSNSRIMNGNTIVAEPLACCKACVGEAMIKAIEKAFHNET
jgi:hypothetical protein